MNASDRRDATLAGIYTILALVAGLWIVEKSHAADAAPSRCLPVGAQQKMVESVHGKWTELTPAQWQFLRGVYVLNPETPPGLPYGDKAALATVDGNEVGLVFFLDGDQACTPMKAPKQLLEMLDQVAGGKIPHEGQGL